MAKTNTGDIQDLNVSWEGYAGTSVEKFIKDELRGACGYIYRSRQKEGEFYYLYGFHSYEDYEAWSQGDTSIVPLFRVQLPNIENDIYAANLYTNSNTNKLVNLGQGIKIGLKYTSTSTNPNTQVESDTYNEGTLIISRSANGSAFSEVGRMTIQPIEHDVDEFTTIDITQYLADGDNKIRLRVEDNVNGAVSNNIVFNSIVNTTLKVTNATDTTKPMTAAQFMYYIEGQVSKTLNLRIRQNGNTDSYSFTIGSNTYIEAPYITPTISKLYDTGTIEVEAWLSVDDTTLESTHIVNQFYFLNGETEGTVIILNNKATSVSNYSNVHFFDFVLYNQSSDVNIRVEDQANVYINYTQYNCQINTEYQFYNLLQIESQLDTINAIVTVTTSSGSESYGITIDNRENMSPTVGANFILNPNTRNNSETTPNRIINEANGAQITSTFTGFNFINDGWVSDNDGYKVLRVPAEHSLNIQYDPLDNLTSGTTIELDYKIYNVFNDNDILFRFDSTTDNKPLGFIMNATEATFYTVNNQVKRDQDVVFQEDVRTHMAINIIPNLANSGLNYIRIFINGVMNREMLYASNDIFKNGTLSMNIGSTNCDIDIYGIRIYKKALSAGNVRQDYMSTIPTLEGKLAFKAANDILSANGTISFDKASVKYNTLIWVGNIPSKQTGDIEYAGKLKINKIGDPEHSGVITNLRCKGQGSSSKGYWKWNQQYDWNKLKDENEQTIKSVWTDGNGEEHRDGYKLTGNDPAAKKLVAKLNWASSMQSHKQGSTALYTDLWREIVGGNSITKTEGFGNVRVTVHEEPFLFFVQDNDNSTPVFYGLMTFGSGKFDKPTFGYDEELFPDYLVLEGTDNGVPLTLRQVPWFEDEVTYNDDENAEYYEYAGQGNWDYGMGNQNMLHYFIDASNFVYQNATRLKPYTNASELDNNLDKTYQYWNTTTGNIVRYDYINGEWVNGGITKTNGEYDEFNIFTQTGITPTGNNNEDNAAFIQWRINNFKTKIGLYYNVDDVLYSMAFLKLIAASDNRCKNTYEYLDPVTHKICLAQDDMDTIMLTDNVGRKTKPYYVEEHDIDPSGKPYFNGSDNNFFSLMDAAFESELQAKMSAIFNQMQTVKFGESAEACLQNYFYSIQEYFPAVAYNETARLLYEEASVAQAAGIYDNTTPAISQSLGNQLEAEKQWFKRRLKYLQSWSKSDPFTIRSTDAALQFRSIVSGTTQSNYQFNLTPWQWLYPKVGIGQSLGSDNSRVTAQTTYTTGTLTTDGNTDTYIYGIDYYNSIGEFGGQAIGETFNLSGKRLLEFSADSREVVNYLFTPLAMTVACPVLKTLSLYGCSTLGGSLNLTNSKKLVSVDLRSTGLTSVTLPETGTLTTVNIPNLTSLYFVNCPNVTTFSADGYTNFISLTTDNSTLALQAITNASNLNNIDFRNINLNIIDLNISDKMYNLLVTEGNSCTGTVQLNKQLTSEEKNTLIDKYGNIDDMSNSLYVEYIVLHGDTPELIGPESVGKGKTAEYEITYSGNDISKYNWTIEGATNYTVNRNKCRITTKNNSAEDITIRVSFNVVGTQPLPTVTQTVDVIENVYINEIIVNNGNPCIASSTNFTLPITYNPANYTSNIVSIQKSIDENIYCSIINDDNINEVRFNYNTFVSTNEITTKFRISIIDEDNNTITDEFNLKLVNPVNVLNLNTNTPIWTRN